MQTWLLWLVCAALAAQAQAIRVEGRVVDTAGRPVAGARVLIGVTGISGVGPTEADGKFVIEDVSPGMISLRAEREGYVPVDGIVGKTIQLFPGVPLEPVTLTLAAVSQVDGIVEDSEGNPLAGYQVGLLRQQESGGNVSYSIATFPTNTDQEGRFVIPSVAPEAYYLRATAPDLRTQYVNGYYPGSADLVGAARLDVPAGTRIGGLRIRLPKVDARAVRGQVIGLPEVDSPGDNWWVQLEPLAGPGNDAVVVAVGFLYSTRAQRLDARRAFSIENVPEGAWRATLWNRLASSGHRVTFVVGDRDVEDLRIYAMPGFSLRGRVENRPAEKLQVTWSGDTGSALADVGEDGIIEARNLHPGTYRVQAMYPAAATVRAVRVGNRSFDGGLVELPAWPGPAPLEVKVTFGTVGAVSGSVEDPEFRGGPFQGIVALVAFPSKGQAALSTFQTVPVRPEGTYAFPAVEAGTYRVCAFREADAGAANRVMSAADYQQRLDAACAKITVKNDETASARVRQLSLAAFR